MNRPIETASLRRPTTMLSRSIKSTALQHTNSTAKDGSTITNYLSMSSSCRIQIKRFIISSSSRIAEQIPNSNIDSRRVCKPMRAALIRLQQSRSKCQARQNFPFSIPLLRPIVKSLSKLPFKVLTRSKCMRNCSDYCSSWLKRDRCRGNR